MMTTNVLPYRAPGVLQGRQPRPRLHFSSSTTDAGYPGRLNPIDGRRTEYCDDELPLILRVSPVSPRARPGRRPVRSWQLYYRDESRRQRRITLGRFPAMGVPQARARAAELLNVVARGGDPLAQRREAARTSITVEELVTAFLEARRRQDGTIKPLAATSHREYSRILAGELLPVLGRRPSHAVTRENIESIVASIRARGAQAQADRVAAILKSLFHWAKRKRHLDANPGADIEVAPTRRRERVLSDDELRAVWTSCAGRHEGLVRLAILTGLRRDEVASAQWSDFDFANREWRVPRIKGGRRHVVWLSELALRVVAEIPKGSGEWLFPGEGGSYTKHPALEGVRAAVPGFHLHVLRHTLRSRLPGLEVTPDTCERVLCHAIPGLRGVYDHYDYQRPVGEALSRWSGELERILRSAQ